MIEALASLSAFDRAAGLSGPSAAAPLRPASFATMPAASTGGALPGADFGDVMAQLAAGVRTSLRTGEATAISGIQGKASTQQVVEAVMSAEQSLQTAIAVRDKVVAAYLELSRMAI
ncbi:flagellar hook-basal body protein FliE [Methylobacterium sp. Leaf469]|uniref:flagellar hook-basal body complex protein FliE n=1 Tax=unclassified Methylobacterium TaxID=2615210 RepID=UPI0006F5749E|nr:MULTISPECIES: flagellar hook-basal body complex protein FliE [unclassified Methylobacterium]USU33513.1 flagellar hook-basal body complex protein FliE [Methylobacterium sp. OTU13CASTA1]KQO69554.1 flagellar hook-basal body protein FliE [Methylobacterium sp. Leaf87]KQP34413.1 flagellar hook-basal body protein FliE [Methylobacterium sp. Leaf102]KQP72230.1 flagellar hook-basal body protein FliE [Methylobacterium sp. Leaf112]KQU05492.1 flagellar hook-basal body protein FliE [Methylobacterium sp. 